MGFFEKTSFFFKIGKGGIFAVECLPYGIIPLKCLFRLNYEFFCQKKLKLKKLDNMLRRSVFSSLQK